MRNYICLEIAPDSFFEDLKFQNFLGEDAPRPPSLLHCCDAHSTAKLLIHFTSCTYARENSRTTGVVTDGEIVCTTQHKRTPGVATTTALLPYQNDLRSKLRASNFKTTSWEGGGTFPDLPCLARLCMCTCTLDIQVCNPPSGNPGYGMNMHYFNM